MTRTDILKPKRQPRPYCYFGQGVWDLVREAYLAGESAPQISERLGPSIATIRKRASKEGWTKRSVVAERDALIIEAESLRKTGLTPSSSPPVLEPRAAARAAMDEAARLMSRGRLSSAFEAARIGDLLARTAQRLDGDPAATDVASVDDQTAFEAVRQKVLGFAQAMAEERPRDQSPSDPIGAFSSA